MFYRKLFVTLNGVILLLLAATFSMVNTAQAYTFSWNDPYGGKTTGMTTLAFDWNARVVYGDALTYRNPTAYQSYITAEGWTSCGGYNHMLSRVSATGHQAGVGVRVLAGSVDCPDSAQWFDQVIGRHSSRPFSFSATFGGTTSEIKFFP